MAIFKSKQSGNYTTIPNEIINAGLSPEALGMLVYLLSLPQDWVIYKMTLHTHFNCGREKTDRMFKELQKHGYIVSVKKIGEGNKIEYQHIVYDKPFNGEPSTAFPSTEDTQLLNTNILKTNKKNNYSKNNYRESESFEIVENQHPVKTKKENPSPSFARPLPKGKPETLTEVEDYFFENFSGLPMEAKNQAERFYNYFSSNGWKVGGKAPMKDWKAAARNWISRSAEFKPKGQTSKVETALTAYNEALKNLNNGNY